MRETWHEKSRCGVLSIRPMAQFAQGLGVGGSAPEVKDVNIGRGREAPSSGSSLYLPISGDQHLISASHLCVRIASSFREAKGLYAFTDQGCDRFQPGRHHRQKHGNIPLRLHGHYSASPTPTQALLAWKVLACASVSCYTSLEWHFIRFGFGPCGPQAVPTPGFWPRSRPPSRA